MSRKKHQPEPEERTDVPSDPDPKTAAERPGAEPSGPQAAREPISTPEGAGDGLEQLRAERDDLMGRLQRVSADYQNYRKRVQKDVVTAREYANEELITAILGVLDDMERALAAAREHGQEGDPLLQGMQIVHDNALATLGRFGVERIEAVGRPFDPEQHRAILQKPSDGPAMTVLQEVQTGYRLKGRTIRPSSVVVSTVPGRDGSDEDLGEDA